MLQIFLLRLLCVVLLTAQYDSPAVLHVPGKEAGSPRIVDVHKYPLGGKGEKTHKDESLENFQTLMKGLLVRSLKMAKNH